MTKRNALTKILIFTAIVVVVNLISQKLFFRLDFTADQRYTLSQATKETLKELDDVITVKAYFSENLPTQLVSNREDFEDQLIEYENRSNGNLVYEFINPNESDQEEENAQQQGIRPLIVNVSERDQVQQMRAYMGATLQMGEKTEIIPVIQSGAAMEYALTSAVKKLSVVDKPKIALLQGHGEPPIATVPQLQQQLSVLYDLESFTLTDTSDIPAYYRAAIMFNPTDTFPQNHLLKLDNYLNQGGGIFMAYDIYEEANPQFITVSPNIGLRNWLVGKGVEIKDQMVIDVNCASVSVPQQLGPFSVNAQVQFPFFPIINGFADHPITGGLESLLLPFVNHVVVNATDSGIQGVALGISSEQSGLVQLPTAPDFQKNWTTNDFTEPYQSVAVAIEGNLGGTGQSKMVVVGSGNFAINGDPQQGQQQVNPDNINFVANAIDWMADDTGLNDLRTKAVTARLLKPLEDGDKQLFKWGNMFLPILLILGYAMVRRQRNLRKRQAWLEGKYI